MTVRRIAVFVAVATAAGLAVGLLAADALGATGWNQDTDARGFKLYGLPLTPDRSTGAATLRFVTPGAGVLKASGLDGTISVATPGTDYLAPIGTSAGNYDRVSVSASGLVTGGATMVAANVTALEALSGANYRDGSRVFVQSVSADFVLHSTSSATVDHLTVASVSGAAASRWVRDPRPDGFWYPNTTFYVAGSGASDENNCTASITPCATFAEVRRRLLGRYLANGVANSFTVNVQGDLGDTDPISIEMQPNPRNGAIVVTVLGTPTVTALGTVASATAHSFGANQATEIVISGFDWSTHVGKIIRKNGTSGTTSVTAVVMADLGSGRARISLSNNGQVAAADLTTGDVIEELALPRAVGMRASFTGTMFGYLMNFDPSTVGVFFEATNDANAFVFSSYVKGAAGGGWLDVARGFAVNGCAFSTRTQAVKGNFSASRTVFSSMSISVSNSVVGRNEWQDSVLIASTFSAGDYEHTRMHSLGMYNLGASTPGVALFEGASMAFTEVVYGSGNNASSSAFSLLNRNTISIPASSGTTAIVADVGHAAVLSNIPAFIEKTDLPYAQDMFNNVIFLAQNVFPSFHLAATGGDLAYVSGAASQVAAIHETSGPTQLTFGAIADTQVLVRSGTTIIGSAASGFVPSTRTLTPDIGILLDGGTSAVTLAANRTIGARYDNVTITANGGGALQRAAVSGDGTISVGSNTFALTNIPSGTTMAGSLLATAIAAPSTPAAGKGSVYVDSTSKNLAVKSDAGVVNHGVRTKAAVTSNFLTAIADDGTVTAGQPAATDVTGLAAIATSGSATDLIAGTLPAGRFPALTGDITTVAGSLATTLKNTGAGAGSCTYCSVTFDAQGRETAYSNGATPEVPLTFSNGARRTVNNVTADLTTGVSGGQTVVGGTGAGQALTISSTTNATKGTVIFGTSSKMFFDEQNTALYVGGAAQVATVSVTPNGTLSAFHFASGTVDNGGYLLSTTANQAVMSGGMAYTGVWTAKSTAASMLYLDSGALTVYANTGLTGGATFTPTARLTVSPSGVDVASLGAGGVVVGTAGTGRLAIATTADVATALAMPSSNRVLAGNSGGTGFVASDEIKLSDASDQLQIGQDGAVVFANGSVLSGTGDYEWVRMFWNGNVFHIDNEKGGAGVLRNIAINAHTADLTLNAATVTLPSIAPASGSRPVVVDSSGVLATVSGASFAELVYYVEFSSGRITTINGANQYIATSSFDSVFPTANPIEYPLTGVTPTFHEIQACPVANTVTSGSVTFDVSRNGTGGLAGVSISSGTTGCVSSGILSSGGGASSSDTFGVFVSTGGTAAVSGTFRATVRVRMSPLAF